jgi:tellurite resistance protein
MQPLLQSALRRLARVTPLGKRQLLLACARAVGADGRLQPEEAELLRAIAENLGCPMPPVFGPDGAMVTAA